MFAILGDIVFQLVGSPDEFEIAREYRFAEQDVIGADPRLQWIANGLRRLTFEMALHASFTIPSLQLANLQTAAEAHRAMPLVFGSGRFVGNYVIKNLNVKMTQMTAAGEAIAMRIGVTLREWAGDAANSSNPFSNILPIGLISSSATSPRSTIGAGISALKKIIAPTKPPTVVVQPTDITTAVIVRSVAR